MNDVNKLAKALVESAEVRDKKKTSAYDTTARVVKVEGTTAWVAIPGGVDKTPARMAVNAKAGDDVRVRVAGGKAYVMGNTTAPPTDDSLARAAQDNAIRAAAAAEKASVSAEAAHTAANNALRDAATAQESADIAQTAANNAVEDAARAHAAADAAQEDATIAKDAADTAKESADQALWGLSTVEDVVGTLNWITAHGTMTLTSDTAINPAHVYFVVDADGDYEVGGTHYSIVTEPKVEELSTYYELTIDESLQNYVGTHLALTNEGLNVISTSQGWRVVIAAGGGTLFPNAGVYLVDPQGNIAQQTNANGVAFNTGKPVTIGDSTASIIFDGNGHINMIGANVTIGGANNVNGTLTILDASGQSIGSWNNNGILLTAGSKFNMVAPDGRNVMNIGVINNSSGYASVSLDVANPNGQTVFKTNLHGLVIPYQVTSCVYDDDRSDVGIPITIQQQSDGEYAFVFQSAPLRAFHLIYSTNSLLMRTKIGTKVTEGTQGISSILIGTENDTYYQYSIAIGNLISNTHTEAFAIGLGLETTGDYQTILGRFNDTDEDGIFAIGSGTGENNRQNIFSIDRAGYIHFVGGMMTNTAVNIYTNCADPSDTKRFLFATDGGFVAPGIIIAHDNVYATDDTRYISLKIDSDGQKAGLWDANYGNYMMYGSTGDTWLYLNKGDIYSSGIYCGTKILRTDGKVRVGTGNVPFTDIYPNYTVVCAPSTSLAWVECRSGTNNSIFIQSRTGGEVELSSKGENGTTYPILRRANNSGAITAKEYWTFEHSPELPNGVYIYSRFTANNGNGILAGTNSSNQMFFGYGSYASNIGETYLDGNKVTLRSKNGIEIMPNANTSINKFNIMDSGNVYCGTTSDTVNHFICVRTKNKSGSMQANTAGTFGLWCDTNSKWLIYINSSGTVIANTSDIRYKENVSDMSYDDALSILREVDVINFSYKDDESKQMQSGVSAQQLRDVVLAHDIKEHAYLTMGSAVEGDSSVYTDITMPDKDIRYEIDYSKLVPVLWKGWQYQDKRIKELEAEIERMKAS